MFEFKNIYEAYICCRKNKRNTYNAIAFEINMLENLWQLHRDLNTRSYTPSRSICFFAETPKLREIFAAYFRDRVVHHLLVNHLYSFYDKKFIFDVFSNRQNKGIHTAVKRVQSFMLNLMYSQKKKISECYFMQMDIRNFFYSIDKQGCFLC